MSGRPSERGLSSIEDDVARSVGRVGCPVRRPGGKGILAKNSCGTTDLPNALTILIAMGAAFIAGLGWIFKMHLELARVLMG